MTTHPRPRLVVEQPPEPVKEPEAELALLVPRAAVLEAGLADVRRQIDEQRRRLADKRQVAFIREEHVRREFAG